MAEALIALLILAGAALTVGYAAVCGWQAESIVSIFIPNPMPGIGAVIGLIFGIVVVATWFVNPGWIVPAELLSNP